MSTQTPNIGLTKPSSDENYSVSVWNGNSDTLDTEIALRVKTSDIQNSLTSTATNKPLSAAQGKALNDAKVNVSDIQNNLTSTATNKPLSAAQGKSLSDTIVDFCDTHFFNSQMPTVRKGITPFSINGGQSITIGGITIPGYSKGVIVASSDNGDATVYAVDTNGNLYTVYKNGNNWVNGSKLPKNAAHYIGIRGIENQLHGTFANTAEFIKYCRDLRTTDPTPLGRAYCPWTFQCDGISSDGFFGTSGFTVIAFFTSVNYGWIHCLSDNAAQGFVHICVNSNTAYLHKPTTTRTTISLA